jgi:MFS family permease
MSDHGVSTSKNPGRRPFILACAVALLFFFGYGFIIPVLPRYVEDLGFSQTIVGCVTGAFWLVVVLTRMYFGSLVDINGHKRYIVFGAVLSTIAYFGYQQSQAIPLLVVLRFLHGLGFASATVALMALAISSGPSSNRAAAFSIYSLFCFSGYALGPILGEHLANTFGTASVFWGAGLLTLCAVPAALRIEGAMPHATKNRPIGSSLVASFSGIRLNRAHFYLLLLTIPLAAIETFVSLFARENQLGEVGIFFFAFTISMVVSRLSVARILAFRNQYASLLIGACLCLTSPLIMSLTYSHGWLVSAACLMGLGWGIFFPLALGLGLELSPGNPARSQALFTCVYEFSFFLGQLGVGTLIHIAGYRPSFGITAGLGAICATSILIKMVSVHREKRLHAEIQNPDATAESIHS